MRKTLVGALITVIAMVTVQVLGAGAVATPQTVAPTLQTINGRVSALVLSDGQLFVGGQMTVPFNRLGAVDPVSGAVVWAPTDVPTEVRALAAVGDALFVGGDFGLRVYSTTTFGLLTTITCGQVRAIEPDLAGTGVFVGGSFTTCGGQAHKNLARVDVCRAGRLGTVGAQGGRHGPLTGR